MASELHIPSSSSLGVDGAEEFSVLELFITLARYKGLIIITTIGCTLLLGGIGFLLRPEYTANVTLLPPQQNSSAGSAALAQLSSLASLGGAGGLGIKNPVDMYVALMQSVTVEDAMIRSYNLQAEYKARRFSDARKELENHVKIEANPKDGLIRLSFSDHDPRRAAELANGYIDQYRALTSTLAIGEASQRRLFFQQQLEDEKNKLIQAEEDLKRTQQSTGLVELDAQARSLIQQTAGLRAQISAKEVQIASLRTYAASENTDLQQAQQELTTLRSELARVEGNNGGGTGLNISQKLPQVGLEYVRATREVKYHETLFEILARQFEVAKLDEAREGATIQVVDTAIPPDRRSGPKRLYYLLVGFASGAFVGTVLALYRSTISRNGPFARRVASLKRALLA